MTIAWALIWILVVSWGISFWCIRCLMKENTKKTDEIKYLMERIWNLKKVIKDNGIV